MTQPLAPHEIEQMANDPSLRRLEAQLAELATQDEKDADAILAGPGESALGAAETKDFLDRVAASWFEDSDAPSPTVRGRTALLRDGTRPFGGFVARGPSPKDLGLWLGAAALLAGGSFLLAEREAAAPLGTGSPPTDGKPIYLDEGAVDRPESSLVPMPETVDFGQYVAGPGPFKLRVIDLMRDPRHDETRTLFSDVLYTTQWSHNPTLHPDLPEVFRIEVTRPGDVVGTSPRWVATYLRP